MASFLLLNLKCWERGRVILTFFTTMENSSVFFSDELAQIAFENHLSLRLPVANHGYPKGAYIRVLGHVQP
jgi:hypothetical protein